MSDIFVEVDEALKQEKLENLWQKYGGLLIGAIIAIILGTAANAGYDAWKTNHDTKQTGIYLSAIENKNVTAADLIKTSEKVEGGLKTITEINAASAALKDGNKEEAAKLFAQISADDQADENFRALATYMTIHTSSDMSTEQKLVSLEAIANDPENPWNLYAKLDAALILGEHQNDFTKARKFLQEISETEKAPKTLRQKAQSINILYALKEIKK